MRLSASRSGLVAVAAVLLAALAVLAVPRPTSAADGRPIPTLAYYYIWYDHSSWARAKTNYPTLGRYSSDDVRVLQQHVKWAQSAGIDGFIVSWKHTPTLDRRLADLVRIANNLHFKLAIIYQGLDFYRRPLPAARVASDLQWFAARYGSNHAFQIYAKPLVIWSGTWKYTLSQMSEVVSPVHQSLLLLASEKNLRGYERVAGLFDGDAYYWSSVNPQTYPNYPGKLTSMSAAIHAHHGLWVAPAAAGFDARLVGGHQTVSRRGGQTLRDELNGALASSPDAVGVISWNEFSENSEIEPSRAYGSTYLNVLRDALGGPAPTVTDFNSDNAGGSRSYGVGLAVGAGVALLLLLTIVLYRAAKGGSVIGEGSTKR
jgi:Glycosyl hydrolase family 71